MVALREDPAVPAGHGAEFEQEPPVPRAERKLFVRQIALERDAVDDRAAEPERTSGDPVRAVGADHRGDLDRPTVDTQRGFGVDADVNTVAKLGPRGDRLLDEKCVQPPALRHQADHAARFPFDLRSVAKAAARARDPVFDDGLDGERQLADRPHREPSPARLVPWEPTLVY